MNDDDERMKDRIINGQAKHRSSAYNSRRDLFAAAALHWILANPESMVTSKDIAKESWKYAYAMIEADK